MNGRQITLWMCCLSFVVAPLGLGAIAHAQESPSPSDNMKTFSMTDQTGFQEGRYRGKLTHIAGDEVVIKTKEGEEVRLHRDESSKMSGQIKQGDTVEAQANDQKHLLSLRPFSQPDAEKTNAGKKK
ncbi:MAG TPA: hypothetical protein PKD12_03760 [Nitrospira sp.]|nr:hypothetical protein [Nitrospira sp.]